MAEKKMKAAEKKAAAEAAVQVETTRKATERKRLIGAGAVLAAVALFVGGYAMGNSGDDVSLSGSETVFGELDDRHPPSDHRSNDRFAGPRGFEFPDGFEFPEGFEFPGPGGDFDFPRDFEFPDGFEFPEGFEFPGRRRGFDFDFELPERFDVPGNGGFSLGFDCFPSDSVRGGFHCEFSFPEFPFSGGPFSGDELLPDVRPPADEVPAEPGFLGVAVVDGSDGVVVAELFPGSPAADGGIEVGDVVVSADGFTVDNLDDLISAVSDAGAGTVIEVTVMRGGELLHFEVVLGVRPN
jgi:membrane-associated protease RseP (regulator of RpoE activity)